MTDIETTYGIENGHEVVKDLFTRMMNGDIHDEGYKALTAKANGVLAVTPELEIQQGTVIGKFGLDSISAAVGSRAGFSISIAVATPEGDEEVDLRLNGTQPAFDIRPIVEGTPTDV